MTISTNYNPSTLLVQRNLTNATNAMNTALERMSTGFRVNRAADDAAGMYVSTGLTTQIRGLAQARKNTLDGISLLQTASGAMGNMKDILQRLRDLSVQASNGVYSNEARAAMQAEADALSEQLYQIKNGANFNGMSIFSKRHEKPTLSVRGSTIRTADSKVVNLKSYIAQSSPPELGKVEGGYVPQAPPTNGGTDLPVEGEPNQPEYNTEYEKHEYNPGVQMTGKEMLMLKSYLESGGSYDEFLDAFKLGEHTKLSATASKSIMAAAPAASIGTEDFAAGQTKVVTIDGVNYTIKNKQSSSQSLIWRKDDTGMLSFEMNNFELRAQSDVSHNIDYIGKGNTIYGGDKDDIITARGGVATSGNTIYAGAGNDNIILSGGQEVRVYLQSGNNTVTAKSGEGINGYNVTGGTGDDTFNLDAGRGNITCTGGNNVYNIKNYAITIRGGADNDTYNILNAVSSSLLLIDNGGTNTINNTVNNSQTNNVISGNFTINGKDSFVRALALDFAAGETKSNVILSDGKSYTIKNNKATSDTMLWKIVGDTLTTVAGSNYTITANEECKINITIDGNVFYGSSGNDDITLSYTTTLYLKDSAHANVTINSGSTIYGGKGSHTYTVTGGQSTFIGDGNNTYYINAGGGQFYGGDGDDKFIIKAGMKNVSIIGGGGNNTVEGDIAGAIFLADMSNAINNATSVKIGANQTITQNINGIDYSIKNRTGNARYMAYSTLVDGTIAFISQATEIRGDVNKEHKASFYGQDTFFYGGNLNDTLTDYNNRNTINGGYGDDTFIKAAGGASSSFNGQYGNNTFILNAAIGGTTGNGDNTIIFNTTGTYMTFGTGNNKFVLNNNYTSVIGGNGNNTYEINGNNCNVTGGTGNDTFLINGNNNQAFGAAGNDYFVIGSGTANNILGGSGNNYMVDNGIGTINPTGDIINDPNAGFLYFNDNTTSQTITLFGKLYKITNTTTEDALLPTNQLQYSYNQNTGEITFSGSNFTIEAENGKDHNIAVRGSNNVVKGGDGNDRITITAGTNNRIEGTSGNNIIVANTAGNKLIGGTGNDNISSNFTQKLVEGTAGTNTIVINANNTIVKGGSGTDKITVKGQGNNVDGGLGNDNIFVDGNNNDISSSSGDDTIGIRGNANTLNETGNTNNTIAIEGENNIANLSDGQNKVNVITSNTNTNGNTITAGNGGNSFTIQGNLNKIDSGSGLDSYVIYGNTNNIKSGSGNDNIKLNFGTNNEIDAGDGADSITVSGQRNQVQGGAGNDTIYIGGTGNIAFGGNGNDYFEIKYGAVDTEIDGEGGRNEMFNKGTNSIYTNVIDVTPDPIVIRLQVGANADRFSAISFETEFYIGEFTLDFSSVVGATENISKIDELLNRLNSKNSELGAVLNRLDSVLQSQTTQTENLMASRSTIIDADIAEESAIFVKNQILQQTSSTLLVQSQTFHKNNILGLIK